MGGPEQKVDVDLGGQLFADGPSAYRSLAALPLEDGYTTSFRNIDVQRMRVALKQLRVAGTESVTVPAGEFKAWKLEISSAEGEPGDQTV